MNVLKVLRREPDQAVEIRDDTQAKRFLCELGLGNAFSDPKSFSDKPTVQICGFDGLKSHIVLALLFSGCLGEKDNGYIVFCAPRSGFEPGLKAEDFAQGAADEQSENGVYVIRCPPPNLNHN
jgi:hypothetical protein